MVRDSRTICRPWAQVSELPVKRPDLPHEVWDAVLWQASELLYALSGRQYSGNCESQVGLVRRPDGRACWSWPYDAVLASDVPAGLVGTRYGAMVGGSRGWPVVALPDPPITELVSVELDGEPVETECEWATGQLWRRDRKRWPASADLQVVYRHGIPPPVGGRQSAVLLAVELGKAFTGDSSCKLPKRVQTITREGVTVGFQDSFDSLERGRTGIWEIDVWLRTVNPLGLQRRARVWSPDRPRLRRTL
ncbi:hypothetical protein [Pseudonocardia sp. NPDC049635]|uniref:hypothetical protein n=1 Tax=Pseudonocardia sp. NPDC049635 TaxID=3155506 RepID=UPI0033FA4A89